MEPSSNLEEEIIEQVAKNVHSGYVLNKEEIEESLEVSKHYLSFSFSRGKLGIAFYNNLIGKLSVTEIWEGEGNTEFPSLQLIKFQISPEVIICPPIQNEIIKNSIEINSENISKPYNVVILKGKEFGYEASTQKLIRLKLPELEKLEPFQKLQALSSLIDLDKVEMIKALGGLLNFLLSQHIINELEDPNTAIPIYSIEYINFGELLHLDLNTLSSLHIFMTDNHPSALGKGKAKEGLSLFGIMNRCQSPVGRRLLKNWFFRPVSDVNLIMERLDTISFLIQPSQAETIREISTFINQIKDIEKILSRIDKASSSILDWTNLSKSCVNVLKLKEFCKELSRTSNLNIFSDIENKIDSEIQTLASLLIKVIDVEQSKFFQRLIIQAGISEELDKMKKIYAGLPDFLTLVAKEEMENFPNFLVKELHIVYYPQLGFLLAIPLLAHIPLEEQLKIPSLEFQFYTSSKIYFKNSRTRELDEYIGDIHNDIVDLEGHIARQLESHVLELRNLLIQAVNVVAELDCFISLSEASKELNFSRPTLTHENVIYITKGRNPIQELCVETFIPNDTALAYNREGIIQMITGPNFSGKSVYLKQVGLITYLAHLGCFVPAESCMIGLIDRIFCRIQSRESLSLNQSTFLIDCSQVGLMIRHSSERSLLLIDEFGKGTNPLDGIALLGAAVNHFIELKEKCPKIVIATHFGELFEYNLLNLNEKENLQFCTMDMMLGEENYDTNRSEIIFLYKLIPGILTESFGIQCAKKSGIPMNLIKRAEEVAKKRVNREPILPLQTETSEAEENYFKKIVDTFINLDCETGNIKELMDIICSKQDDS